MRRGEPHVVLDHGRDLACHHVTGDEGGCVCIPLTVNGRTNAMVHVAALGDADAIEAIDAVLPPRPENLCSWCDHRRSCPEGRAASSEITPWSGLAD